MKLGVTVRNMGPQSTGEMVVACARSAEAAALESVWVVDHIAIPPDDSEGSGGRYLDPLATLAFLAGATERIGLGVGVLVLPYRPLLPTAKWIATIQELSGGRLLVGAGVGWMEAEFRALGVDRSRRGALTDEALDFLNRCFESDEVELNGQRFLFRPRPTRPPLYVGGGPPHALRRTVRYGDGWMPIGLDPDRLAPKVEELNRLASEAGRATPEVVMMGAPPLGDPPRAKEQLAAFAEAGVTRFICGVRYDDVGTFRRAVDALSTLST